MIRGKKKKYIWNTEDVKTETLPFGKRNVLAEPRDAIVTLDADSKHENHSHEGFTEILFVLEGEGEQTVIANDKKVVEKRGSKRVTLYKSLRAYFTVLQVPVKYL